jgi:hypothetical protein
MIQLETLIRKLFVKKPNGDEIIDLTRASLEYTGSVSYTGYTIVTSGFEMRPDLVSESVYGDPNKLDYILKFNGVSNPLSLYAGQILLIPDENEMKQMFRFPFVKSIDDTQNKIIKPKTQKDKSRIELLLKKSKLKELLPPNINSSDEKNIEFTDDKIIFGGNISTQPFDCPDTSTRAKLKQKLLSQKISK